MFVVIIRWTNVRGKRRSRVLATKLLALRRLARTCCQWGALGRQSGHVGLEERRPVVNIAAIVLLGKRAFVRSRSASEASIYMARAVRLSGNTRSEKRKKTGKTPLSSVSLSLLIQRDSVFLKNLKKNTHTNQRGLERRKKSGRAVLSRRAAARARHEKCQTRTRVDGVAKFKLKFRISGSSTESSLSYRPRQICIS